MAADNPAPAWRNFAAWSAVGALVYIVAVGGALTLLQQDAIGMILRPTRVTAQLGLVMIASMAVVGVTGYRRPLSLRAFRNFLIQNAVAITLFLLALRGYKAVGGAMRAAEGVAAVTGLVLVAIAFFGTFAVASVHAGANLVDDEVAADEMRERGRLLVYSFAWMAACGLLLVGLSLAGPGGLLSPAAALAGAMVLIAILVGLWIVTWRMSDELGRTLSHETGNMAFYLILAVGGGWAMLAHLGFAAAPPALGWLTLFIVLLFVASFVALGRRKLLTR
ncbi:MAG: hypothetical protein V4574_06570 [Pseudomonadota bacterium]